MRIDISIRVNLREETIEAFRVLEGEPTEKALSEYILAHGVVKLENMVLEHQAMTDAIENINGAPSVR